MAWICISRKTEDAGCLLQRFLTVCLEKCLFGEFACYYMILFAFSLLVLSLFMKILFLKIIFLAVLRLESQVLCILGGHCHWAYIRSPHDMGAGEGQRCWGPWGWSYRWLWAAQWVLGTEPGRAVSASKPCASSPAAALILRHSSSLCSLNAGPHDTVR